MMDKYVKVFIRYLFILLYKIENYRKQRVKLQGFILYYKHFYLVTLICTKLQKSFLQNFSQILENVDEKGEQKDNLFFFLN